MKKNHINLKLVKFSKKFITKEYISWLNNKKINKFSEQRYFKHTYKSSLNFYYNNIKNQNLFFASVDIKKNEHIGNIIGILDKQNSICEIRIFIGQPNQGYGLRTFELLFNNLKRSGIRKIFSGTLKNNTAMINIYKKMGMRLEWTLRKHYFNNGKYIDGVVYSYFNKKFIAPRLRKA
jgi:RimJ/RimL family protein N-acetyltransferase